MAKEEVVERAVEKALAAGMTSLPRLRWELRVSGGRGARGSSTLRTVLRRRDAAPAAESALETRVIQVLRKSGLPPPERQVAIWDGGHFVMRADLVYSSAKLIVEVDGFAYHSARSRWESDRKKDLVVRHLGYSIVRVTSRMLDEDEKGFVAAVRQHLTPSFFSS
ncbi:MAG: DUF559 domain-containing protein [Actinobacteria bacterium]|nr:DUF559 domain-containing protein [Actinomycetota bacterium]